MSEVEGVSTQALMVFCEGPHDVAFCQLIFRKLFKAKGFEHKFSDYPAPLNSLFRSRLEQHLLQDMQLDMAHKFFLPDSVLHLEVGNTEWLILLFNSGGKDNTQNPKSFLENYLDLYEQVKVFPEKATRTISDTRYLFLYDVDDQQPEQVIDWFSQQFAKVNDDAWLSGLPRWVDGLANAAVSDEKAVYLWSHQGDDGRTMVTTLEDIVLPIFRDAQPELVEKSKIFIDTTFSWSPTNGSEKSRISVEAKCKKAVIATLGQRKKPGGSMNVIISQSGFVKEKHLKNSPHARSFSEFIRWFMGLDKLT